MAWTYPDGQTDFNPLVARGVVYGRGPGTSFVALDAATGRQIWVSEGVTDFNARGINYWESKDGKDRRLIFSAANILQEIDALTGKAVTTFGNRRPRRSPRRPRSRPGDNQPAEPDAGPRLREPDHPRLGDQPGIRVRARRHPRLRRSYRRARVDVPHRAAPGRVRLRHLAATAPGRPSAGANNWGEQSIDEKRGIVYVPTGSPKYNFYGGNRKGANLFGDCLIALDARTGKRLWHFQTVHHDIWDLDNNSAPQL